MSSQESKHSNRSFPCPICAEPREIRETKNGKPYITCDSCAVQLFVRGKVGITRLGQLLETNDTRSVLTRFAELEGRYHLRCAKCGRPFWISPALIETSWFDGGMQGLRCPSDGCGAIVPWKEPK
jgi:DNA-directed RNA polymerase subunit RPC12/RpoP